MPLDNVRQILLVLSGKGGVGKSSVTTQLALALALAGHSVGVLDIDLTGPSIPRFFGIENAKVRQAPGGWLPVAVPVHSDASAPGGSVSGAVSCMSLGFLLASRGDAVVWRGPKKTAMVRQFLSDVCWPALDYLLVDTPPGTSDEHISLLETLLQTTAPGQLAGAVVVTTPQAVSVADVKKELSFCQKTGLTVLGVVENMAGFVCPMCAHCTNVFSSGGGEALAADYNIHFLGSVPIDPAFVTLIEEGTVPTYPQGTLVDGEPADAPAARAPPEQEPSAAQTELTLAEKYQRCSLYPTFRAITEYLVGVCEGKPPDTVGPNG